MNVSMSVSSLHSRTILLLVVILTLFSVETLSNAKHLCRDDERASLVRFNESLSIINSSSSDPSARPKTASWDERDCCSWDGVECDNISGHIVSLDLSSSNLYGSINSSSTLFLLVHLQSLNLAYNDFSSSAIPSQIGLFKRLTVLNLSSSQFYGRIPSEMTRLLELKTLDLGRKQGDVSLNAGLELEASDFRRFFRNMSSLEVLVLRNLKLSSSFPDALEAPSLAYLNLYGCYISGSIPSSFGNLTNLQHVNLGSNNMSGPIPNSLSGLKNLNYMSLYSNDLSGPIPSSLGELPGLTYLHIGANNLSGEIPLALFNLTQLEILSLADNRLTGRIPSKLSNLAKLVILYLGSNQLLGSIPNLQNISHLQEFSLPANQLTGQIPSWLSNLTQLDILDVGDNQLRGSIPDSIFELENLNTLYLGPNQLTGTLRFEFFTNLRNLQYLQLQGSNLTVVTEINMNVSLLPEFLILSMSFCNLEAIPSFLRYQDDLYYLDLSGNNIPGDVPNWLGNQSRDTLKFLDLGQNLFTGFEQPSVFSSFTNIQLVDLSNNKIRGQLPILPPSISYFDAGNNSLSGKIPTSFCGSPSLIYLILELNNLNGTIPTCLGTLADLSVLNLANNFLRGEIPGTLSNLTSLTFMDLSGNQLDGLLPSLVGCQMLETVDLSNNSIAGGFPYWSGDLPNLEVLFLRSNQFSGQIKGPGNMSWFSNIRILDLSYNNFTGTLPSDLFLSFSRMKYIPPEHFAYLAVNESHLLTLPYQLQTHYVSKMILANKGAYMKYWKISNVIAALDLSSNRFQGDIPVSLGSLKMLNVLSLSHNHLSGHIPSVIGNLSNLESLDLSANSLSGEIPLQLSQLTFLEYFNVSYNHLAGPIPQGTQFRTFDNSSYEGNLELCGEPLSKKCQDSEAPPQPEAEGDEGSGISLDWKVVLLGYGCGLVLGLSIGFWFTTKEQLMRFYRIRPKRVRRRTRRRT